MNDDKDFDIGLPFGRLIPQEIEDLSYRPNIEYVDSFKDSTLTLKTHYWCGGVGLGIEVRRHKSTLPPYDSDVVHWAPKGSDVMNLVYDILEYENAAHEAYTARFPDNEKYTWWPWRSADKGPFKSKKHRVINYELMEIEMEFDGENYIIYKNGTKVYSSTSQDDAQRTLHNFGSIISHGPADNDMLADPKGDDNDL